MLDSIGCLARLARAGFVLAREGVFAHIDPVGLPAMARIPLAFAKLIARSDGEAKGAARLPPAMARLGPSYVKLGQFLATRPDLVGPRVVTQLEKLQDRMPPFGQAIAVAQIEAALGKPLGEIFVTFGPPVAAASIAQVHKARVRDDTGERDVAVKVLRPGVERMFKRDLGDMYFAARLAERFMPDAERLKPVEVVDTLARSVRMEMDFRLEAASASEFRENVAKDPAFRVPAIDWERTAKEVMTLAWVGGTPLGDLNKLHALGYDLPALGRSVLQNFLLHAMRDGFFHADMHQGNLFIDTDGVLTAVDFGIMGRLGEKERRFLAEILFGFIRRDYRRVAEVHFEAGYVPRTHRVEDFALALRAIGEPIHSRRADEISMAKLLTLLFEITALFDMTTRVELVMLQKTMVVVEGVARTLDPKLDIWSTSEPVVRTWIEGNLGPLRILGDLGRNTSTMGRFVMRLPEVLLRAETLADHIETLAESGLEFSNDSVSQVAKAAATGARTTAYALWTIAALLALIAWGLAHGGL